MPNRRQWIMRGGLILLVLSSISALGLKYVAASDGKKFEIREQARLAENQRTSVAPPSEGMTVITTQRRQNANRAPGSIVAIGADGRVRYYNKTYHSYWDVDPVPDTTATVTYVAAQDADDACPNADCWRNVIEKVNLTTGKTVRIYEQVVPNRGSARWHDVDSVNDTDLLVADIAQDRVFLVDARDGVIKSAWEAHSAFHPTDGGSYPDDWTHLNDVERLPDGRTMVSVRNMDQVVFLDHGMRMQENWTLGRDGDHSILYEQHNPDYIPGPRGGPAVLVSDSENNRIVEYQRTDSAWRESWVWADTRLQWPRDADRLPSGRTLITDTHGGRILEVASNGTVVWQLEIIAPYEAERLGTGDESTGGPSATQADLASRQPQIEDNSNPVVNALLSEVFTVSNLVPNVVVNGLLWIVPPWMGVRQILAAAVGIVGLLGLVVGEIHWRYTVAVRRPFVGSLRLPFTVSGRNRDE